MSSKRDIKPITYLKSKTAELVFDVAESGRPVTITQNREAKVVLQDIESYEQAQETMAFLRILALGRRQIEEGKVEPAANVIKRLGKDRRNR